MYCKSINCFIHLQLILIQPEDRKSTSVTLKPGKYSYYLFGLVYNVSPEEFAKNSLR